MKVFESGSVVAVFGPYMPPLQSWYFTNDGASDILVRVDGAVYTVKSGEVLRGDPGERLSSLRVITTGVAWRFGGSQ